MKKGKLLLGDKLEKIIESTLPKLSAYVKKKDCGCKERKDWLNQF